MSLTARMIVVLTCVGLISGGFLASVGILTTERIALNKQKEIEAAINHVVPGTQQNQVISQEEDLTVYDCLDEAGQTIGYAVMASGTGFQDKITLMFGTDPEVSRLNRMAVLDQKETPGLGAKITSQEDFLRYWEGKNTEAPLLLHKPAASSPSELSQNEINTITGATISSEKVLSIVNLSIEKLKQIRDARNSGSEEENVQ